MSRHSRSTAKVAEGTESNIGLTPFTTIREGFPMAPDHVTNGIPMSRRSELLRLY
jgi:hypothetical protein